MIRRIAFRCDGSFKLGLGDVVSCIRVANACKKLGLNSFFISRDSVAVKKILEKSGYESEFLPEKISINDEMEAIEDVIDHKSIELLMLAKYDVDARKYSVLKERTSIKLCTMDFWGRYDDKFDFIVNWEPDIDNLYKDVKFSEEQLLLGPKNVVLDEIFLTIDNKPISPIVKKILITMGGSDYLNLSYAILDALRDIKIDIELELVLGAAARNRDELDRLIAEYPHKISVSENVSDLAMRMVESDLAFCSGGLTLFELLALGIPTIVIAAYEHQEHRIKYFSEKKACYSLGRGGSLKQEAILEAFNSCLDFDKRQIMSSISKEIVGKDGVNRIAGKIKDLFVRQISSI